MKNKSLYGISGQEEALALKQLAKEQECKQYLGYCVKEGALDPDEAQRIIDRCTTAQDWTEVYNLMDYAEYLADLAKDES